MLSDEEKKAIEILNYIKNKTPFIFWYEDKPYNRKETINTVLNLIEKDSKEIEELKEEKAKRSWVHIKENGEVEPLFYVSEDKIKAKIEEAKKNYNDLHTKHLRDCGIAEQRELAKIEFGQSLLEKE